MVGVNDVAATNPVDSQVVLGLITTLGGIVTTFMTLKIRSHVQQKARARAPKDRMETIFDGYESLIKQQQVDIDRKQSIITSLESIVERLQAELTETRGVLSQAKNELVNTQEQNKHLQGQLRKMRDEYSKTKPEGEAKA
jgi:septal ring factor EnvC (AmiA/AmiB activator)